MKFAMETTDNDCLVDEDFNLQNDVNHCGTCNFACLNDATTNSTCNNGNVEFAGCGAGYYDIDGSYENGYEYRCDLTNDGVEQCDGEDNDRCDGIIDEGLENEADPLDEFYDDANCDGFDVGELRVQFSHPGRQ